MFDDVGQNQNSTSLFPLLLERARVRKESKKAKIRNIGKDKMFKANIG